MSVISRRQPNPRRREMTFRLVVGRVGRQFSVSSIPGVYLCIEKKGPGNEIEFVSVVVCVRTCTQ